MDAVKALKCAKRLREIARTINKDWDAILRSGDLPVINDLIEELDKSIIAYPARVAGRQATATPTGNYWQKKRTEVTNETLQEVKEYIKENNL